MTILRHRLTAPAMTDADKAETTTFVRGLATDYLRLLATRVVDERTAVMAQAARDELVARGEPVEPYPDFRSRNLGSIIVLQPLTPGAWQWCQENLGDSAGPAEIPVEPRYFYDIAAGVLDAGLTLQDATTGRYAEVAA